MNMLSDDPPDNYWEEHCDWCDKVTDKLTNTITQRLNYDKDHPQFVQRYLCQGCLDGTEIKRDGMVIFVVYVPDIGWG